MSYKYVRLVQLLKEQLAAHEEAALYQLPTEQELCRLYDVSRQTVRKALAVLEQEHLIEKRHGSGSYAVRRFTSSQSKAVAILVSCDDEYLYPALLAEIKSALKNEYYQSTVYPTNHQVFKEREILKMLLKSPPRGLISEGIKTAVPTPNLDLYEQLAAKGVSILFFHNTYPALEKAACIQSDDFQGGYDLGMHLIHKGHTHIAGIFNGEEIRGRERYYGLISALRDELPNATDIHAAWFGSTEITNLRQKQDTRFLTDFIHQLLRPCTAILCHDDEIAYWLIKELSYTGYQVPEQVSVASFGNTYLSTLSSIPITSMAHENRKLGTAISTCLLQMIAGMKNTAPLLTWRLVSRASVMPPPHEEKQSF